jgi:peptidoglycan/xylan/chitin deacetylase (PgdA/CDA1 family)
MNCKLLVAASAFGLFAAGSAMAQDIEIATWAGFRKAATSFTFDDGPQSNVDMAMPIGASPRRYIEG